MQNRLKPRNPDWTILKLLNWATSYLSSHNIDSPRGTAEILLAHTLKSKRIDLYLCYDQPLCSSELAVFKTLIKRRIRREPVAYIVGTKAFWTLDLAVTPDVLIPRPDTECLVETAMALLPEESGTAPKQILELGTGSGAVILALASQRPLHHYIASDRSMKAAQMAKQNAVCHALDGIVHFVNGNWLNPFKEDAPLFDMILSNPPYIPTHVIKSLQPEIYRYEPLDSLDGGKDGLGSIKHIISFAHHYLKQKGDLLLEIGFDQKKSVHQLIDESGHYENVVFIRDYGNNYRVVHMTKK